MEDEDRTAEAGKYFPPSDVPAARASLRAEREFRAILTPEQDDAYRAYDLSRTAHEAARLDAAYQRGFCDGRIQMTP